MTMLAGLWKKQRPPLPPRLEGERIFLRLPEMRDAAEWCMTIQKNKAFLKPWSPSSALRHIHKKGFAARHALWRFDSRSGAAHVFFIFGRDTQKLIGGITLGNIIRGAGQMATLGYWMDQDMAGKGYMTEAVGVVSRFAFDTLGLHRLQAGCLLNNTASHRVLLKNGFEPEGIAKGYIKIDGEWQDHLIFAKLKPAEGPA
jgi:ribosomal-protein-alanine N-acetyltransferase